MPAPSTSLATLRPDLAQSLMQFDLAMDRQGFIGLRVAPVINVGVAADEYGVIPLEQLLRNEDTSRAPGASYRGSDFTFTTQQFMTRENGFKVPVDDNQRRVYANYFDAEVVAAQIAMDRVLRNHEKRIADLVFNTSTWTGSALTTGLSTKWDQASSATPIVDVNAAAAKVYAQTGMWPNAVIMDRHAFRAARSTDEVKDAIASAGAGDSVLQGRITAQQLAQAFDVDQVIVAGGAQNTAKEGQSRAVSTLWDTARVMVCRVATTNSISEPCIARTFHYSEDGSQIGTVVESYRDEDRRSDMIRARHQTDERVVYKELGHLITGVL